MNRKDCRHESAAPERSRHLCEQEKQQKHTNCVQQQIREMMAASLPLVQLPIEHVREPGEWMPIIEMAVRERPRQSVQCETAGHIGIIINIFRVIIINEVVTKRLPENQPRDRR